MRIFKLTVGVVLALVLLGQAAARADERRQTLQISQWTLANGMRVIFAPQRRVPAVTVQVWYHVGSKNEVPGIRGVAHMFEHMMFKGSKRVPPEAHARLISALGGDNNAFTSQDVTAYHNTVPRQYMEFALQLEAERMQHLMLTPATIKSEREVVKEEKRMRLENSPIGRALEALYGLAYTKHPYAWTPAGVIADLDRVTQAEVQAFYETYYVPNNATLIVVGDVQQEEVRQAAERQLGPIARGSSPPPVEAVEPPQQSFRHQLAEWPSQLNVVLGAYHLPAASSADLPALKVLQNLLAAGRSSRLHQQLVRQNKLALQAGGFVQEQEHPGLFVVYAVGLPGQDLPRMKEALLATVEGLASAPIAPAELTKVKNQLATQVLQGLKTLGGLAYQIGQSTFLQGDPRAFFDEAARIDAVGVKDVKRVAQAYLTRTNLSLVELPAGKGGDQ